MARKTKAAESSTAEPVAGAAVPAKDPAERSAIKTRKILKKKDFLDLAVGRAGMRKSAARTVVDATLATLAQALADRQEVVLPPLGRVKVMREKPGRNGRTLVLRLVLDPGPGADQALAGPGEAG
jgi:DNA-binding protein HU-alpha